MSTTTPNFGWVVPTSSDLVKNGAVAIETLGDSIDASMVDLKGGTTGQVLSKTSATDMDFTWITAAAAGASVNLLLNSNFALNQRSYVSAANLASGIYGFDRWKSNFTNTTLTFTASTQGQSLTINSGGGLQQVIEQGLVPAGTYTLSWTGTATARVYNSGGTPPSYAASPVTFTADGAANVVVEFTASGATKTLSKVQFNYGTNTTWALATPTLQSELDACQRYYIRFVADSAYGYLASGIAVSTTNANMFITTPVTMRTIPASLDFPTLSTIRYADGANAAALTGATISTESSKNLFSVVVVSSGGGMTAGRGTWVQGNNSSTAYFGFSAEL
jgi:hypothetical protein